jgi:hypothetical protein
MKVGLSNKRDHDLHTDSNHLRDLIESLERIDKAISSGI